MRVSHVCQTSFPSLTSAKPLPSCTESAVTETFFAVIHIDQAKFPCFVVVVAVVNNGEHVFVIAEDPLLIVLLVFSHPKRPSASSKSLPRLPAKIGVCKSR
jgi:hypothetical protein